MFVCSLPEFVCQDIKVMKTPIKVVGILLPSLRPDTFIVQIRNVNTGPSGCLFNISFDFMNKITNFWEASCDRPVNTMTILITHNYRGIFDGHTAALSFYCVQSLR
jgi:hypothetical protein